MKNITATAFYNAWIEVVTNRKDQLLSIWRTTKEFTYAIKGSENSVIDEVAQKLDLLSYPQDYYSIDAILYREEDRLKTPKRNPNGYHFIDIRVAFEHENNFSSGIYQEVTHLLLLSCDLRVVVTYPNDTPAEELEYLHEIISSNRQSETMAGNEGFLLIFGYENGFCWEGFIYEENGWKKIK